MAEQKATNITWHETTVTVEDRNDYSTKRVVSCGSLDSQVQENQHWQTL